MRRSSYYIISFLLLRSLKKREQYLTILILFCTFRWISIFWEVILSPFLLIRVLRGPGLWNLPFCSNSISKLWDLTGTIGNTTVLLFIFLWCFGANSFIFHSLCCLMAFCFSSRVSYVLKHFQFMFCESWMIYLSGAQSACLNWWFIRQ